MERYAEWSEEIKHNAREEFRETLKQAQLIIKGLGFDEKVQVNTIMLGKAIIDYIEDVERLEDYSGIISNITKTYAYSTYWFLKRAPIVPIDPASTDPDILHINERACAAILISKIQKEKDVKGGTPNEYFVKLMYYNFKYRIFTPKTLELMIEAYFNGCDAGRANPLTENK